MKKILAMLTTITSLSSITPIVLANSSAKIQENKIINNKINYLQTNNLETINRNKRQAENSNRIKKIDAKLIINRNNPISYRDSCVRILQNLRISNILGVAINFSPNSDSESWDDILFTINSENYDYLRIPVVVESNRDSELVSRNLELVFRTSDFYLEGFIVENNYYHFSDAHLTEINNINSNNLQLGSAYRDILPEENQNLNWQQIFNSFNTLTEMGTNNQPLDSVLSVSLANVILVTAEAIRFKYIFNLIRDNLINNDNYITWGRNRNNEVYDTLTKWRKSSKNIIKNINSNIFSVNKDNKAVIWNTGALTRGLQEHLDRIPIETIKRIISNSNIRILLYSILKNLIKKPCDPSSSKSRKSRDLRDDVWTEKFCSLNPQVSKINGDIKLIKIINENTENDNLEEAYIYVLTTESLYLIYNNEVYKLNNFNQKIDDFWLDDKGKAFIKSNDLEYPVNFYKLENTIFLTIIKNLNEIITNPDLGALNGNGASVIKDAVKKLNPSLDINGVGVSNITNTSADIEGLPRYNSDKYQEYKKVYFKIKPDLSNDFKTCIEPVNDTNDGTILNAVKAKNPDLDISQVYVKQKVVNGRLEIGVKSDSNKYNINSKPLGCNNFKVKSDLNIVITNTNLGALNDNNDQTIINAVKTENHNLANLTYTIRNKTNNSAEIWIDSDNDYYIQWSWRKIYFKINCTNSILTGVGVGAGGGAVAGALTGASMGSIFPGVGTVIGAGVGAVFGFFTGSATGGVIATKTC